MPTNIFTGTVKDFSSQGLGVVEHPSGIVYFVPGAFTGDEGEFEIISQKKRFGFARVKHLTRPSHHRKENPCEFHGFEEGQCGGCLWLGLNYQKQLEVKQKFIEHQLKIRKIDIAVNNIWPSPRELGYRNRAQFKTDGEKLGYITPGTNTLAPIKDCLVLNDTNRQLVKRLLEILPNKEWAGSGRHKYTLVDLDDQRGIQINQRNVFRQANEEQNQNMKEWLSGHLSEYKKEKKVLELFCGSGNFTEVIVGNEFKTIVAVESDDLSIKALKSKFSDQVESCCVNIYEQKKWSHFLNYFSDVNILVLDPPREGFPALSLLISKLKNLEVIFYISCDVQTFCHNVEKLGSDWRIEELQPLDQFPQTPHIELLAKISKN